MAIERIAQVWSRRDFIAATAAGMTLVTMLAGHAAPALACTSAVVTPAAAAGGRALLWKNRDSEAKHNEVVVGEDGKFRYVGVVNGGDDAGREIWMGVNERGLAVMNTAADDLAEPGLARDGEGRLLKVIMQGCATVADVERLLARTDKGGRDVNAQVGAIDDTGAAVFFEVGQRRHVRYDARDPGVAPGGYIIRTNFGLTAKPDTGWGYIRKARAEELFARAVAAGRELSAAFILTGPSLDLGNSVLGIDPRVSPPPRDFIDSSDTISRYTTVSAAVFEAARAPEPPYATTMWVALGQPLASLAVPVWPVAQELPVGINGEEQAGLEALADRLRLAVFPHQRGSLFAYLDTTRALALRRLLDAEQQRIFELVAARRAELARSRRYTPEALAAITREAVKLAEAGLRRAVEQVVPVAAERPTPVAGQADVCRAAE